MTGIGSFYKKWQNIVIPSTGNIFIYVYFNSNQPWLIVYICYYVTI